MLLISVLLLLPFKNCLGSKSLKTKELLDSLLTNYSAYIRPGLDGVHPLSINLTFNLVVLSEFNEVKSSISTVGFMNVEWIDERVKWSPGEFSDISSIYVDAKNVWVPTLAISNPADRIYHFSEFLGTIKYSSTGEALWKAGSVTKTICNFEILTYPFDEHTCDINVIAWGVESSEIILRTPRYVINLKYYNDSAEWELMKTYSKAETLLEWSMASFGFTFRRKPTFLIVNVLVPIIFLSHLNPVVFLIPHESGERVTFSITVLLSYTVFLNVIGNNIPKTPSPLPVLCYYVISQLILSGLITLLVILCQRLHHIRGKKPVPMWLTRYMKLCCQDKMMTVLKVPIGDENKSDKLEQTDLLEIMDWKHFTIYLDQFFFWLFLLAAISIAMGFIVTIMVT